MTAPFAQPGFDSRISTLAFPVGGGGYGSIQRGFMVWDPSVGLPGDYSSAAQVNFLYNPSTVSADYNMMSTAVGAGVLFPTAYSTSVLAVPLNQSVEFSLLFDRTYELWGSYATDGTPNANVSTGSSLNPTLGNTNPSAVGVLADIMAMEQFTGMFIAFSSGNTSTTKPTASSAVGWQGIIQMIPSYVYFGGSNSASTSLWYYGYISEWDVTVTHWSQYMVPMRCVINVTLTMLPPPTTGKSGSTSISSTGLGSTGPGGTGVGASPITTGGLPGVGGT